MKCILIGNGSIGRNRANILNELGVQVRAVDIDEIHKIDEIITNDKFDFGLICTPTAMHLEHVHKLVSHKLHFFCEKPLYSLEQGSNMPIILAHVLSLIEKYKLINMVACNWRFSDKIAMIPSDTKFIKVRCGHNLAQWKNDGKYLESYSANKSMGGGILLDAIHEIDYLYYKFGKIKKIEINRYKVSDITNDTEDYVTGMILFDSETRASIELDYLSKTYQRFYEYIDSDEKLVKVDLIDNSQVRSNIDDYSKMLYNKEMTYFINCVIQKQDCMNDINDANYLLSKILSGVNHELI